MSDSGRQPTPALSPADEEWLRRFLWHRGITDDKLEEALPQVRLLVGQQNDRDTMRRAAFAVVRTLNAIPEIRKMLMSQARSLTHSADTASELVQHVVIRILVSPIFYKLLGGWDESTELFKPRRQDAERLLIHMLRNRYIDLVRTSRHEVSLETLEAPNAAPESTRLFDSPLITWNQKYEQELWHVTLARVLEEGERDPEIKPGIEILRARSDGERWKEIAARLNLTLNQTRYREKLAVAWLRQKLADEEN